MRNHSLMAGLGLGLMMAALGVGLNVSATPAWSASDRTASDPAPQTITRTLKGDRSPLAAVPTGDRSAASAPAATVVPELPDGCEPVISSIGDSPLARMAGRCLS